MYYVGLTANITLVYKHITLEITLGFGGRF